jgi:putative protease
VQLKGIKKPDDFKLFYRIYHPILLMTSRQCLFHQVTGCEKECIDDTCIPNCEKIATITNIKNKTFILEKSKGNYHAIYNEINYLNIDICNDFPNLFSGFMIDLRDICTETKTKFDKSNLIKLFKSHIDINSDATLKLKQNISQTTDIQYKKGL